MHLPNFRRDLVLADVNRDGLLDVVVVNDGSADVSVLLGRGDGTFEPQRRFNATAFPFAVAAAVYALALALVLGLSRVIRRRSDRKRERAAS